MTGMANMGQNTTFKTIDAEVGGEAVRLIISGAPAFPGRTMLDKLNALRKRSNFRAPAALRLMSSIPLLRDIPGRVVGIGLRPEGPNAVVFRTGAIIQTR